MSRILHLVNMGLRYGRSKGVRESRQEEPPLGSLALPCHLEESASHHELGAPPLEEGGGAKHSPPGDTCEKIIKISSRIMISENHQGSS